MAGQDMTIWGNRWQALKDTIKDYRENSLPRKLILNGVASNQSAPSGPSQEEQRDLYNLKNLIHRLEDFAEDQFGFFYDGFSDNPQEYNLEQSPAFHPDYVLGATLEQIAFDFEVLRRIADQRLMGSDLMKETLYKADKLAWRGLYPVIGEDKLVKDTQTTVITYFEKDPSIRVIPYASVALIAIPFSAMTVPRDFLTIAHEVGHYVYRHSQVQNDQGEEEKMARIFARELLDERKYPRWVQKWREEIFADVYDCLVAGPVIALASQDLALQSSLTPGQGDTPQNYRIFGEFTADDGEHPVPILRPSIYINVLKKKGAKDVANLLETRWKNREEVKDVERITSYYGDNIPIKRAHTAMDRVVEEIFECFSPGKMVQSDVLGELWQRKWSDYPAGTQNDLESLYQEFDNGLAQLVSSVEKSLPLVEAPPEHQNLWKMWIEQEKLFPNYPGKRPPTKDTVRIGKGYASKLEYIETEDLNTWNHVFHAGGWATKPGNHKGG